MARLLMLAWKRFARWGALCLLWLLFFYGIAHFHPFAVLLLFFGAVIASFALLAFANVRVQWSALVDFPEVVWSAAQPMQLATLEDMPLPPVPTTIAAVRAMDDRHFEYLSAALVMAKDAGHRFIERSGGSGDRGVDVRLRNLVDSLVLVQSKRFDGHDVRPTDVRDFIGTMYMQKAAYGYLVTSMGLTKAAAQEAQAHGRIHVIDGEKIAWLLCYRYREVQLALQEVLASAS